MPLDLLPAAVLFLVSIFAPTASQPNIGVNYGELADNLPPPSATAALLESTSFSSVRLYGANPAVISALSSSANVSIVVGTSNADIASLASSPSAASQWLSSNAASPSISVVSVGNEVLSSGDQSLSSNLLPAMQNLQSALPAGSRVRVSTVHSMAVMSASDPPSSGAFHADLVQYLNPILKFLSDNGGPFMINPYPYFAYRDDPRPETLAYCLFQPNLGRLDPNTKLTYMNMFDAQVDAIKSALNSAGFGNVEIVVAETGWPYKGDSDEVGASVDNAAAYNGNLVKHLRTMVGTPLMPGRSVDTYIFALYDEDLKPGPTSERSFGLYRPDSTAIYDAGLSKSSSSQVNPPVNSPSPAATVNPSQPQPQPQPAVDCRQGQPETGCNTLTPVPRSIPSSGGPPAVDLLNKLFTSVFSCTYGFSLSFLFQVTLPLLLLS